MYSQLRLSPQDESDEALPVLFRVAQRFCVEGRAVAIRDDNHQSLFALLAKHLGVG
jgi:hypothetical protein